MKAIIPNIDETSKRPYYLQLYDYIKNAILQEKFPQEKNFLLSAVFPNHWGSV